MPVGICPQCQACFVVEAERTYQRTCPRCLCPMHIKSLGEAEARLAESAARGPANAPADSDGLTYDGTPLAADERGQRVLAVIAEAEYQREQARARRAEARRWRADSEAAPNSSGVPWANPAGPGLSGPERGVRGGAVITDPGRRAADLCRVAAEACAHAREIQLQARMLRDAARVAREDRPAASARDAALPPLDFVLFSESFAPTHLDPEHPPAWLEERFASPTTLYVWGYGPPESALCRVQCLPSGAAARFAARAGWDSSRPGAWAKETLVLQRMTAALREIEPIIREDSGVAGWGMQSGNPAD